MRTVAVWVFLLLVGNLPAQSQPSAENASRGFADVASVELTVDPPRAKPGELVTVRLTVTPKPGFWTYPSQPPEGQASRNILRLPKSGDVILLPTFEDPTGAKTKPDGLGGVEDYYPNAVTWEFRGIVAPTASAGPKQISLGGSKLQVCNTSNCFYSRSSDLPQAQLEVENAPAVDVPEEYQALVKSAATAPAPRSTPPPANASEPAKPGHKGLIRKDAVPLAEYTRSLQDLEERLINETNTLPSSNLWAFLATAWIWGWISLATPCVFPMIPITVSLFLKQGNQSAGQAVKHSLAYSLTIILVLGISAVALLSVFRKLSVDPYMNIALGGLFVFFALSLFGAYDITLPSFLLRFTERRRGAGGYIGTIFGALAFSIVSFTCVAPFLGGFAGMAASGQFAQWELVLGGLTFATAFASPFFILALFPSLLKKLPRSGGWLDTVKAVMGFLELAAAFKFFRTAELRLLPQTEYFTYDVAMTAWIVISVICGVYLLGFFRLPHDDEDKSRVGVTRLMFALFFIGLGIYLLPAIFKTSDGRNTRPGGVVYAWIDAFLLPDAAVPGSEDLGWSSDLPGALARARPGNANTPGDLIFLDFTGKTCQNCKLNENRVFPRPEIAELLKQYSLVQMYTDEVPEEFYMVPPDVTQRDAEAAANIAFQERAFGTQQLPLYVILAPQVDGKVRVVGIYDEGKINDIPRFTEFLSSPLKR